MRPTQKSNRARGRGNRKSNGNAANRVYDSSGPEGKVRGTPQQIIDKYLSLARDAQTSGDRVMAENFLQHAEHYQRILLLATAGQPERRDQPGFEGEEDGVESPAMGEDRPRRREPVNGAEHGEAERAPEESSVGGLTTIDTDDDGDNLLVAVEEVGASQPAPRRRRTRGQRTETTAEAPETAPTETGEAG